MTWQALDDIEWHFACDCIRGSRVVEGEGAISRSSAGSTCWRGRLFLGETEQRQRQNQVQCRRQEAIAYEVAALVQMLVLRGGRRRPRAAASRTTALRSHGHRRLSERATCQSRPPARILVRRS